MNDREHILKPTAHQRLDFLKRNRKPEMPEWVKRSLAAVTALAAFTVFGVLAYKSVGRDREEMERSQRAREQDRQWWITGDEREAFLREAEAEYDRIAANDEILERFGLKRKDLKKEHVRRSALAIALREAEKWVYAQRKLLPAHASMRWGGKELFGQQEPLIAWIVRAAGEASPEKPAPVREGERFLTNDEFIGRKK